MQGLRVRETGSGWSRWSPFAIQMPEAGIALDPFVGSSSNLASSLIWVFCCPAPPPNLHVKWSSVPEMDSVLTEGRSHSSSLVCLQGQWLHLHFHSEHATICPQHAFSACILWLSFSSPSSSSSCSLSLPLSFMQRLQVCTTHSCLEAFALLPDTDQTHNRHLLHNYFFKWMSKFYHFCLPGTLSLSS